MPLKSHLKHPIYEFRSIGEAINATFAILRAHGGPLVKTMFSISTAIGVLYFIFAYISQQELMQDTLNNNLFDGFESFLTPLQILNVFLSVVFSVVAQMSIYAWIRVADEQEEKPSLKQVWHYIASRLGVLTILGIALILIYFLFAMLFISVGMIAAVAIFFLFIPLVFVLIKLSLTLPALTLEETGFRSFLRSWEITKGEWFNTFAYFLVLGIINYLLTILVSLPLLIIAGLWAYFQVDQIGADGGAFESIFLSPAYFLVTIISNVLSIFMNSLLTGVGTSVWFGSLVDKKESVSIKRAIAEAMEDEPQVESEGEY